ncbi:MAG: hypothetical protein GDA54_03905 [Alphaproteobacteria bacterium GM7ARS4]|nr:hypothetical protein [Alphaproteobacteria bacterium GM7ARS4]
MTAPPFYQGKLPPSPFAWILILSEDKDHRCEIYDADSNYICTECNTERAVEFLRTYRYNQFFPLRGPKKSDNIMVALSVA